MLSKQTEIIILINTLSTDQNKIEIIINCDGFIKMRQMPFWLYYYQVVVNVTVDGMRTQN